MLSPSILFFTDLHSAPSDLVYTLAMAPVHGSLALSSPLYHVRNLNATHKFTQADILQGRLTFSADREIGAHEIQDWVVFNVTDPSNNVLTDQVAKYFVVLIVIMPILLN